LKEEKNKVKHKKNLLLTKTFNRWQNQEEYIEVPPLWLEKYNQWII